MLLTLFASTNYDSKKLKLKLSTTTTGKRSDGIPPGGNDNSLLEKDKDVSEHPPFTRYKLGLEETLELAILPFPLLFPRSAFISEIFLTFFSWTYDMWKSHINTGVINNWVAVTIDADWNLYEIICIIEHWKIESSTFQNLMVLSFVDKRNRAPLAVWHHLILLIFSSISKLLR